jgi:NitT/TauT family transport system permease protein
VNNVRRSVPTWWPPLFGLMVVVAIIAAIQGLLVAGVLNRYIVPLPTEVMAAIPRLFLEEDIFARFLTTLEECLIAFVLVAMIGIALGALLYRLQLLRAAVESSIAAFASAPIVLMYPLFLVVFGRATRTVVIIGLIAGLPPVILKTVEGLATTRRVLIDVGRSFNLSQLQLFAKILFPAALPTIFVGLRLGLIFALINIIGVEFLINFGGLGQIINDLAERYDIAGTYAAILFVVAISMLFFAVTEWIERWLRSHT